MGRRIMYIPGARVWHRVHEYRLSWSFIRERAYWIGRSRRNLAALRSPAGPDGDLLGPEHQLLRRILTQLIPREIRGLLRTPGTAWKRLGVALFALFFVALG